MGEGDKCYLLTTISIVIHTLHYYNLNHLFYIVEIIIFIVEVDKVGYVGNAKDEYTARGSATGLCLMYIKQKTEIKFNVGFMFTITQSNQEFL